MRCDIHQPVIDGKTVVFAWDQSGPNPFQSRDAFSIHDEGIVLSQVEHAVSYEIFFGLQLTGFAAYDEPVEVVFLEPISPSTVAL